jgi:protein-S-isoprenylcysteine O-methyltransferase Ste14
MTWKFVRRLILGTLWNSLVYGIALFGGAGTLDWWRAWIVVGMIAAGTVLTMLLVFRTRPDLLEERMRGMVQKGQPMVDRLIVLPFMVVYGLSIAFIGLDVFNLHLLPKPSVVISSLGLVLIVAGWWIIGLVFRENSFAAPVIKHQTEREHKVVDTGVYSVVRHPMYAGIFIFNVGIALWLESYAGAIAAIVPMAILAVRILFEEKFLREKLAGYPAYLEKVRYRLIPFVW